ADGGEAVAPQNSHVNENVRIAAVRHDEPVAFGDVEPFDPTGDLNESFGVCAALKSAFRFRRQLDALVAQFSPLLDASTAQPRRPQTLCASRPLGSSAESRQRPCE